jgi:hypothetical protein
MTPEPEMWSYAAQRDNPPRFVRLQQLHALLAAFGFIDSVPGKTSEAQKNVTLMPKLQALLFKRNSAGVVVGMTTPANSDADAAVAVAAALGFSFDAQGNIVANIVPRTGTLASLLALDGGIGELSSATDFPAIVKHDGVAGEAVALMPFGAVRVTPITAVTFNFGAVSVRPDVRVQVLNPTNIGSEVEGDGCNGSDTHCTKRHEGHCFTSYPIVLNDGRKIGGR